MTNMWNLAGWREVECREADRVRGAQPVVPGSSLTDPSGEFGWPVTYTEWWSNDQPVLRDYLFHPDGVIDRKCEHYIPTEDAA